MAKRFAIGLQAATPAQEAAFRSHLETIGAGWWHWIPNFWLVISWNDGTSAENFRDALKECAPGCNSMVIEIEGTATWYGFGPIEGTFFGWMHETWKH